MLVSVVRQNLTLRLILCTLVAGACIWAPFGGFGCHDQNARKTSRASASVAASEGLSFHEPSQARAAHKHLVVLIHGLGDTPQDFSTHVANLITATPARFIAPRGIHAHGSGWGWFAFARPLDAPPDAVLTQMRTTIQRIAALIRTQRHKDPNAKVVVVGFSQGGMLSFALALQEPDLVDAVLPIAGWLPKALVPPPGSLKQRRYPPIRALHGGADALVPLKPTRDLVEHLRKSGLDARLQTYSGTEHVVSPTMNHDVQTQLRQLLSDG